MTSPQASHTYHNPHAQVNQLNQGENTITNITVQNVGQLQRLWTPPTPPALRFDAVPRQEKADAVIAELERRGSVAIGAKAQTVALQGMAGVGKTTLALLLAQQLQARYPDGVLWVDVGPTVTEPTQMQPILNQWASHALGTLDQRQLQGLVFTVEAVRALLAEHAQLLVILDNVWSLTAIAPLRQAMPPGAHLLMTTRSRTILRELGGGQVELATLSTAEAEELVALRLAWPEAAQHTWVQALIGGVGHHPLALDVALGRLRREGDYPTEWQMTAARLVAAVQAGVGFGELRLDAADRDRHVEAVLAASYLALQEDAQTRWRSLGAFALDAPFATPLVAALWGCDNETARRQLVDFANAALLTRLDEVHWQQHSILRGYALALAYGANEAVQWRASHATVYRQAIQIADDAQRYYELLPALPQLRHAVAWALDHDLTLAQGLIANCATLFSAFGFGLERLAWCEAALNQAKAQEDGSAMAQAWISLGNALSDVANLANQPRVAQLARALAAYDDALRYYRPDTAPLAYAATQNNRGTRLSELANLPDEDRTARLHQALAAYDDALRFRRPDTAPLDYAMTQGNCGLLLQTLASEPGEDRQARLQAALQATVTALSYFHRMHHAPYQQWAVHRLKTLRSISGAAFVAMWQALDVGEIPDWLQE